MPYSQPIIFEMVIILKLGILKLFIYGGHDILLMFVRHIQVK